MNKARQLRLFYTAGTASFILLHAAHAEAVCPACIAGAGFGAANAFVENDLYRLGFWLAGFSYLAFRYVQTRLASRKYGTMALILPSALTAFPLFYFTVGMAMIVGVQNTPILKGFDAICFFTEGSVIGSLTTFTGTVGTCALKERYSIRIPFFRITAILTLLWLVSLATPALMEWVLWILVPLLVAALFWQEFRTTAV